MYFQSCEQMNQLKDESVHLVVTSPPYLNLKDYGVEGQIGYGEEPETYDERLKTVYSEVLRVLKPGRMFCINVGDVYTTENKKYQIIPLATITILNAIESGFEYKGSIIWEKIGKDTASGGNTFMGSMYTPPKIYPSFNHEMILLFQKEGKVESYPDDIKALSRISLAERAEFSKGIWRFPGKRQTDHQAPFPFELPYRLILMYSMVGDTVLDPFMGSGTTAVASKRLNRKWAGYELNPAMKQVIKRNLARSNDNKRHGFWRVLQEIDGFRSKYKFKLKSGNTNGILYGNIKIMWLDKLDIKLTDCYDKIIVISPNTTKRIIRYDTLSIIHSESLGFLEGECVRLGEEK